jgi:hypothetical protein
VEKLVGAALVAAQRARVSARAGRERRRAAWRVHSRIAGVPHDAQNDVDVAARGVRTATLDDRATSKTNADAGERAMSMLQD